jgi:hypothetical protein
MTVCSSRDRQRDHAARGPGGQPQLLVKNAAGEVVYGPQMLSGRAHVLLPWLEPGLRARGAQARESSCNR